ncbi:MAG: hypothetical protein LBO20_01380 [Bifidobacteriaceae bacterium]|jgi:uncharacterized protein (DUF1778 family)|nr:hypothetical protein [Bifidobacteriaceae bacterium]
MAITPVAKAKETLGDRLLAQLDGDAWMAFAELLNRSAGTIPELAELFAGPAPWDK